ncbi:MAG: tRNA preQ1(34) S-adenosylmethionine ribosyltransferase-isomerase QueA [Campylobacterota bacterium]|nr:tRNA preQ1(34) S-adenosylmethionine ribosyltransferase-isomerase QueA [Campylobacterota bacterium]
MNPLKSSSYEFVLPDELIATHLASPRDSARLLVYNKESDTITHDYFYNLEKYIPQNSAIILNDTKVIKARLYGKKSSGGKIELLINKPLDAHRIECYIKGRVHVETLLEFNENISAYVIELQEDGSRVVEFSKDGRKLRFEELLEYLDKIGHVPLPPYINREDNSSDESEYQSVFALNDGAVAAPTASLHFSDEQFEKVKKKFLHAYVTLHVGSGTFKPVECEDILEHPMHSEYYNISQKAKELIDSDVKILSIGTTSTRTVEYYVRHKESLSGEANLFLNPSNPPQRVDYLLTNFHLPKSTLLMLVASFVGLQNTLKIYNEAIKEKYRFYSYGDAMLIL